MADERATLFGEARRFARTSGAVGGIAARVAGNRLFGIKTDKAAHAEDLKAILGGLKGPLMKVAQFLTTIPDALPPEYAEELAQLQANAPAMGAAFVRRRMMSELGPDWRSRFASFDETAAAAASLGQVHRATLHDGRQVACKLQYPDMAEHGGGRPQAAQDRDVALSPHGQRDPPGGHLHRARRALARGARLHARGRADAPLRPDAARRADACTSPSRSRTSARTGC